MSTVTRPRGPQPPRVYWVRRLLVLGVALLLVVGIARLLGGGSDGSSTDGTDRAEAVSGQQAALPSYGPTVADPPTTSGGKKGKKGRKATPTPQATPAATPTAVLPAPSGPCADSDVIVTPVTGTPLAGAAVVVRLDFTTRTSLACTVAVSPETVALKLTSGQDFIWSTQRCPKVLPTTSVVARREVPGSVNVVWSGRRANSACDATARQVLPGWYHAIATVLGGAETDVQFQLGLPVAPTVTRTAEPSPSRSGDPVATPGSSPTGRPTGSPSGAVEPTP